MKTAWIVLLFIPALLACNRSATSPAPEHIRNVPAFDQRQFSARCIAVAARQDTDPAVLAADKRTCACLERTLKPADFSQLLDYTEIDQRAADADKQLAALYRKYDMNEGQFRTELKRVQAQGRLCLTHH